jgi:hypothetical protein
VLGVSPAVAGFREARVQPELGDLAWVKGDVPTPHGKLSVKAVKNDSGYDVTLQVPDGVTVHAILPGSKITLDGRGVTPEATSVPGKVAVTLPTGQHSLSSR